MAIDRDDVISVLNDLIETCRDGQEGFRNAAEHVKDSHLKQMFMEYSTQRAQFLGQLQNEAQRLGDHDPEKKGCVAGSMHRGWMNLKSSVTGYDDQAIVNECERGEDTAVSSYKDALEKKIPENIRTIIESQYQQVKEVHDRVSQLKHSYSHT